MTTPNRTTVPADILVERTDVPTHTGFRLSWGAIIAGLVMATALQTVLTALGGAIGLAAFDQESGRGLGIGAAIWAIASILISLFLGGRTTGRLAGVLSKKDAFLHGALLWSLSTLLTVWMVSRGVGAVTGAAFRVAGATAGAVASGAGSAISAGVSKAAGGADDVNLRGEIETLLRQTGDASLRPESLSATAGAAGQTATGTGSNDQAVSEIWQLVRDRADNLNREDVINVVVARTGRSRADAERIADRVVAANQKARSTVAEVREQAGTLAEDVASGASTGLWFALLGFGLSLAAAVLGSRGTARE
ncbi:MAG TPA: hypothetical protein VE869_01635 [Gemmatimonas sp.]|nr:hypothetical protein [Gemmatimonas sp.]